MLDLLTLQLYTRTARIVIAAAGTTGQVVIGARGTTALTVPPANPGGSRIGARASKVFFLSFTKSLATAIAASPQEVLLEALQGTTPTRAAAIYDRTTTVNGFVSLQWLVDLKGGPITLKANLSAAATNQNEYSVTYVLLP